MTSSRTPADRRRVTVAALLAVVSVLCCAAVVPVQRLVGADRAPGAAGPSDLVLGAVWPVVGALVVRARPRHPVGWLLLATALVGPYELVSLYAAARDGAGTLGRVATWVSIWGFAPYFFTLPVIGLVFPDGHPSGPRWRLVLRVVLVVAVLTTLGRMFSPVPSDIAPALDNPYALPGGWWLRYVTLAGSGLLFAVGIPLSVVALALRMRRAEGVERTQLQWLVLGGVVLAVSVALPLDGDAAAWSLAVGLLGPPTGIAVAMLRHRLFDVELTLSRTLAFGVLTALVVALYAGVVYGVQLVAPGSRWGILLVAVAALAAATGRDRVQDLVDRSLFGHRHDAYAVVARVGRDVAAAVQPVEALQRLVDGLRQALRLPAAAFTGSDISVTSGTPVHGSRVVPCSALGVAVGELHVGLRSPGETWSAEQTDAVEEVAARAGTLAYAATLVADVARSRGRIVAAREEERRRLRADLHDGVAPSLAGAALQLESLARRLDAAELPELAARALALRDGLRHTVTDLRALVHGLRPPVLDQLGLAGALRQLLAGHDVPACTAEVGDLGRPHAAVEVAAYAIAAEAFSNALRHSSASRVRLAAGSVGGELVVLVEDNGVGLPARRRAGVGLASMAERAAEVGGRLDLLQTSGGGTTVRATLPEEVR